MSTRAEAVVVKECGQLDDTLCGAHILLSQHTSEKAFIVTLALSRDTDPVTRLACDDVTKIRWNAAALLHTCIHNVSDNVCVALANAVSSAQCDCVDLESIFGLDANHWMLCYYCAHSPH